MTTAAIGLDIAELRCNASMNAAHNLEFMIRRVLGVRLHAYRVSQLQRGAKPVGPQETRVVSQWLAHREMRLHELNVTARAILCEHKECRA